MSPAAPRGCGVAPEDTQERAGLQRAPGLLARSLIAATLLLFTISEEKPGVVVELGARVPGEHVGKGELKVKASSPQIAPARLQRRGCPRESVRSGP